MAWFRMSSARVGVCLALGVCTSAVVSWALVKWPLPGMMCTGVVAWTTDDPSEFAYRSTCVGIGYRWESYQKHFLLSADDRWIMMGRPGRDTPDTRYRYQRATGPMPDVSPFPDGAQGAIIEAYGFPLPCASGTYWTDHHTVCERNVCARSGLWDEPRLHWKGFPTHPLWGGLAVDTVFFGAAWHAVMLVPGAIRGRLRRRAGVCGGCGYDRRGLSEVAVCPECGGAATL